MEALFLIVMVIAIASAILMLLSENAVHSALFLIVNFGCVAVLYLMLDAPFLAMIQIAVYAGAIMVLFLFVIMLLGAEKLTSQTKRFIWLTPLAIVLAAAFALIVGAAILNGEIDLTPPTERTPQLRVVHAAPYAGSVDVYANGELLASDVSFSDATDFVELPAGDYTITLNPVGTANAVVTVNVSLEGDSSRQANTYTAVAYGGTRSIAPEVALFPDNVEAVDARTARLSVFNGTNSPVNLVDFGSDFDPTDDRVLLADLAPGMLVELPLVSEDTSVRSWAFTGVDAAQTNLERLPVLVRLNNPEVYSVKRDTAQLLVVSTEGLFDGTTREVVFPLVDRSVAPFGGPQAVGQLLFSRFVLPFQLIAILLLAAMIGAIVLTHKEGFQPRRRDVRRKVMKPLANVISEQVGSDVLVDETPLLPEKQAEPAGD